MKRQVYPIALLINLLASQYLSAQVTPTCGNPPPPGAESCGATCVYCDFNGVSGTNSGSPSGGGVCGGAIGLHNDQWYGFIAGSESVTVGTTISGTGCTIGDGLQLAIFDACTNEAIACNAGSAGGGAIGSTTSVTAAGLVVGQTYYFMLDGYGGDVCNYTIDVLDGSVTPPPVQPVGPIDGPTQLCPGAQAVYTIASVEGAGQYLWTAPPGSSINGGGATLTIPAVFGGTQVTITFGPASGNVCVKASNACSPAQQQCLPVLVAPIPPTVLPTVTLCPDQLPFEWQEEPFNTISAPGTYNLTSIAYDSYLGCDSLVKQKIIVRQPNNNNIGTKYICEGECFQINGNNYCESGSFEEHFMATTGCDSAVVFSVVKILVNAVIAPPAQLDCTNPLVVLSNTGSSASAAVNYSWTNAAWTLVGTGDTYTALGAGVYRLIAQANVGAKVCRDTASVTVSANGIIPTAAAAGDTLDCSPANQNVNLAATSNLPTATYQWSGPGITPLNQNFQNPQVAQPGTYVVTVTNPANGCTASASATVLSNYTAPTSIATGGIINCMQSSVALSLTTNISTANFNWNGPGINAANQAQEDPVVLQPGLYIVTVTNPANGCTSTASTNVERYLTVPMVSAGADLILNCSETTVTLDGIAIDGDITWSGPGIGPANQNSINPSVSVPGTYILTSVNSDSECSKADTMQVFSDKVLPVVEAGLQQTITCTNAEVVLSSAGSDIGPDLIMIWEGPGINSNNQYDVNPTVNQPGQYSLVIFNLINGCKNTDFVDVLESKTPPNANAGQDWALTCVTLNGVTLQGFGTPAGILYSWSGPGIGLNNQNLQNPTVTVAGTYSLTVTNPANGCTDSDMALVTQSADLPVAVAGPDRLINCAENTVTLSGAGSSTGGGFSFQWSGPNGFSSNELDVPNISIPGAYTLTVENTASSCKNTDIVVVAVDTVAPQVSAGIDQFLTCGNGGLDTLVGFVSGFSPNKFNIQWSGPGISPANESELTPIVSVAGNYTLTVVSLVNQCTATDFVQVGELLEPPVATAGDDQIINCLTDLVTLGELLPDLPTVQYEWFGPGITGANANVRAPQVTLEGLYTVIVTDLISGCFASDEVEVLLDGVLPIAEAGPQQTLTCLAQNVTLGDPGTVTGPNISVQWAGPGISQANAGSLFPNVAASGTYVLTLTNTQNFCVAKDTVQVLDDTAPPVALAGADAKLDCQTLSVTLDGSQSAIGNNISYAWSGPGIGAGNADLQSPEVNLPGNYVLTVTNADNGCTGTDVALVSQNLAQPNADAGADLVLTCQQNTRALGGAGTSTGNGFSYIWLGPGINSSIVNLQNPAVSDSGTYTLIVTDLQSNCTATDQVYVALNGNFPTAEAGPNMFLTCDNPTVQLDGSLSSSGSGITYAWSGLGIAPGQNGLASPSVSEPGIYTLTVTDTGNGCSKTDLTTVLENTVPPIANANEDRVLTCSVSSVTLTAAGSSDGPFFDYLWQGPGITAANQNLPEPDVSVAGQYVLLVTDQANGCVASDTMVVTPDQDLPIVSAGPDQTLTCAISQVTLEGSATVVSGALTITWSGPGINPLNVNNVTPTVAAVGTYTMVVTDMFTSCSATDQVVVGEDIAVPALLFVNDTITCADQQADIRLESSLPDCVFYWEGPGIMPGDQSLQNPPIFESGLHFVTVTAPNGCKSEGIVNVGRDSELPEAFAEGAILNCLNTNMSALYANIVTPGATWEWNGPNGFFSTQLYPTVTEIGEYILTIIGPNGCTDKITVGVIADNATPIARAEVEELLDCNSPQLTIDGSASLVLQGNLIQWFGPGVVSGAKTLMPVVNVPGTYTLLIANPLNGCLDSISVEVERDPNFPSAMFFSVEDVLCFGDENGSIFLDSVAGGQEPFVYFFNGVPGTQIGNFDQLPAGTYDFRLEDANGCVLDTTIMVGSPSELTVSLGDDLDVDLGDSIDIEAVLSVPGPMASVIWKPAAPCDSTCLAFGLRPFTSRQFEITVVDSNGCIASDDLTIRVKKDRLIYVANAFNPGSDNGNEILMIQANNKSIVQVKSFLIFDRWGEAVFEQYRFLPNDPDHAWKGKLKDGKDAHSGVFVWYAEIEFIDGEVVLFEGDVAVLRD